MKLVALLILSCLLLASGRSLLEDADSVIESSAGEDHVSRPDYKVLNRTGAYELREYANATWAVSFGRSRFLVQFAAIKAGWALGKYLGGINVEHEPIGRSKPLLATILGPPPPPHPPKNGSQPHDKNGSHPEPPPGKHGKHHPHPPGPPAVVVAAFIPQKFEGSPPKPESRQVKIVHTNTTKVYTHEFGGWAFTWTIARETRHLYEALKADGICPFKGKFLIASYANPWQFFGRRNEIWWVKLPKHHHHNDSAAESNSTVGIEGIDAWDVFPEQFDQPEPEPLVDGWPEGIEQGAVTGGDWTIGQNLEGSEGSGLPRSPEDAEKSLPDEPISDPANVSSKVAFAAESAEKIVNVA